MKKGFFLVFLLSVIGYSLLAQNTDGTRYKLAVYVTVTGGKQDDQEEVQNITAIAQGTASNALIGSGRYEMIERSDEFLQQILKEQMIQGSGDVRDDQILQIGASYGAQKICVVGITVSGNYLYVAARIVDVVTKTSSESGEADNDHYTGVSKIRPTVLEAIAQILGTDDPSVYNIKTHEASVPDLNPSVSLDRIYEVKGVTFKMVFVKGGTFQMGYDNGGDDQKPVHSVKVGDFYIGEFEVTQELWKAVVGTTILQQRDKANTKWSTYGVGPNYPMYYVSYYDAKEFCNRINKLLHKKLPSGYQVALPTEAQWEYAARGGSKSKSCMYAGSNSISDVAYYKDNSDKTAQQVGTKQPNELGIYDMSGNVWEWCADWYDKSYYIVSPTQNPRGASSGSFRVLRGGDWRSYATECQVAHRNCDSPGNYDERYGFRIVLVRR